MSSLLQKRKNPDTKSRPGGNLVATERVILDIIKSKKENAIYIKDLKDESHLSDPIVNKCIKNLLTSALIKEVPHVQFKGRKHYIASEFKPSNEITGGTWFLDGQLDTNFIDQFKSSCIRIIQNLTVATDEQVYEYIKKHKVFECTSQQVSEILRALVLDNVIIDVKSTECAEYYKIPRGKLCYRCPAGDLGKGLKTGAMVSIPCGVCPRIRECTPDGLISPTTCVYYNKWLDF